MRLGYENLKPLPIGVKVVLLFMVGGRKGEGGGWRRASSRRNFKMSVARVSH